MGSGKSVGIVAEVTHRHRCSQCSAQNVGVLRSEQSSLGQRRLYVSFNCHSNGCGHSNRCGHGEHFGHGRLASKLRQKLLFVPDVPVSQYASGRQKAMPVPILEALKDLEYPHIDTLDRAQRTWRENQGLD